MTRSEYLLSLRHVYHQSVQYLKTAKDVFKNQMRKMQMVHTVQIKNLETIAVGAAIDMFREKARQVRETFGKEIDRVREDFSFMREMLWFYEEKIRKLVRTNCTQEKMIVEVKQLFHH